MVLRSRLLLTFIFIGSSISCFAAKELPVLTSKQDIKNIRYLSEDGKNTYYQRRSGSLYLSTKFKLFEIIKGKKGSEFSIYSSHHRNNLVITLNRNYHDFLSIRKSLDIYVTTIGTTNAKYIDTGVKPRLHLNDTWISYYSHKDKKIKFRNIKNDINDFEITIGGALNPYFIPEVSMLNENEVIYTDINNNGFSGIIHFNRNTKVFTSFHKSESVSSRLEFCSNEKELFISELSLSKNKQGSKIYKFVLPLKEKMLSTKNIIYKSKLNDYGKLICAGTENNLYFIKNMTTSTGKEFFEAAKLNLVDNKVEVLTDLKYVTDIIYHGGRIIVPLHGKNYVLKGQYELPDDKINFK